jgi:hypothetical protein
MDGNNLGNSSLYGTNIKMNIEEIWVGKIWELYSAVLFSRV